MSTKENNMTTSDKRNLTESDKNMLEIGREAGIADSATLRIIDTMKGKYALQAVKPEVKSQLRVQPKEQGDAKVAEASQAKKADEAKK